MTPVTSISRITFDIITITKFVTLLFVFTVPVLVWRLTRFQLYRKKY